MKILIDTFKGFWESFAETPRQLYSLAFHPIKYFKEEINKIQK